MKFYNSVP